MSSLCDAGPTPHEWQAATSDDSKSVRTEGWRSIDVLSAATFPYLALIVVDQTYTLRGSDLRSKWRLAQPRVDCSDYHSWLACCGFCVGERLGRIDFDD